MPHNTHRTPPIALRLALGGIVLIASWYAMLAIHELGHAAAAWATGGHIERIVLPLLGFSRTDISPNPQPLIVAWAGPIVGVTAPLLLWGIALLALRQHLQSRLHPLEKTLRFFAGFTLLTNGAYLGLGWIDHIGDAGDLLQHGAPPWQLIAFGLLATAASLTLWHGLGPWMGLGKAREKNNTQHQHPTRRR